MEATIERITLFKIGGSLLELPGFSAKFQFVLSQRTESRPLLIVGGGATVDCVRQWDAIHRLDGESAHWLAIRAMGLNERLVEALIFDSVVVTNRPEVETAWRAGRLPILCCFEFLRKEEDEVPDDARLPLTWDVTSDSIAAWVARRWPAEELVLLKSCDPPTAADGDAVDPLFKTTAAGLPRIGWANLRNDSPRIRDGALDMFRRDSEALRRGARRAEGELPPRSSPKTPSRG
jgi:5-(aminomethyl)-3-furanmethanol phosphate kinase